MARNYSGKSERRSQKRACARRRNRARTPDVPFGYRNNKATRAIEIHPEKGAIAQHVFELYATGRYSLLGLSKELIHVQDTCISKTNLHKMLMNPFYIGKFAWGGHTYQGTQPCLISSDLYERAQSVLHGGNTPKYGKHEIAFRGMLTCAHDNCTVTAELKKGKYVYYRCTGYREQVRPSAIS